MISLRDILNTSKTFVVDTIEVLNMHGSEDNENFGILSDESQDEQIRMNLRNLHLCDDRSGETLEPLGCEYEENKEKSSSNRNNFHTEFEHAKQHAENTNEDAASYAEETDEIEFKPKFSFSEAKQLPDYDFGFDGRESDLFHRLSIYEDYRRSSTLLDSLSVDNDDKEGGTDDMNEMDMPNPGSIQHFQRLFYPSVPCMNCASCYNKFTSQIFGDSFN